MPQYDVEWVWDDSIDRDDMWDRAEAARAYRRSLPPGDPGHQAAYEIEADLQRRAHGYRPARPGELNEWGERVDPDGPV